MAPIASDARRSNSTPASAARARRSIAGEESMRMTRWPVACAIGIAAGPFPIASSTSGPSARRAGSTKKATSAK
jgi:hypothetical protein